MDRIRVKELVITVIAYDGNYLVADGRATRGTTLVSDTMVKLHEVKIPGHGQCVVGLCGALPVLGPWLDHLKANGFSEPMEPLSGRDDEGGMDMMGLVVDQLGKCFEIYSDGGWFPNDSPVAIGSGAYTAQHYLVTGHDAITAVKEACKSELTCGGRIMVYNVETGKIETLKE